MLDRLVVPDGVGLIEHDPVPPQRHHSVASLPFVAGSSRPIPHKRLLPPARREIARQSVIRGDHLAFTQKKCFKKLHKVLIRDVVGLKCRGGGKLKKGVTQSLI